MKYEIGDGKWREGNYGNLKALGRNLGPLIWVWKLFAPTPPNEARFGKVFALLRVLAPACDTRRIEKSPCNGLAGVLKVTCSAVFFARHRRRRRRRYSGCSANSIMARLAISTRCSRLRPSRKSRFPDSRIIPGNAGQRKTGNVVLPPLRNAKALCPGIGQTPAPAKRV